jgi:hypothetical protein
VTRLLERSALALASLLVLAAPAARGELAPRLLPTRALDGAAVAAQLRRLATELARARVERLAPPPPPLRVDLDGPLAQARAGAIDEAAAPLDQALDQAAAAPERIEEPALLVEAHLARAAIALARGEVERARALTERLVRWDPAIALLPTEGSPRLRAALDQAKQTLGPAPPLAREDLGGCERSALLVGRRQAEGALELSRVEGCRVTARVVLPARGDERAALARLGLLAVARGAAPPTARSRAWVWGVAIAVAALAAAAAVIGVYAARPGAEVLDVTPHL